MMTPPRMIGHSEMVSDTVLVIPTRDPEGMTGDPARAITKDLQSIREKAWALTDGSKCEDVTSSSNHKRINKLGFKCH